mmetsp:Transcript_54233/g.62654  ORF Transcript_54233/g.62654 Transcript_54233/m.62654 type:complete len:138 (-) Transcript_54233:38-451(-)
MMRRITMAQEEVGCIIWLLVSGTSTTTTTIYRLDKYWSVFTNNEQNEMMILMMMKQKHQQRLLKSGFGLIINSKRYCTDNRSNKDNSSTFHINIGERENEDDCNQPTHKQTDIHQQKRMEENQFVNITYRTQQLTYY